MLCPGCHSLMQTFAVEAVLATTVDVHACMRCHAFWFAPYETLHLTRTSTLQIFKIISEHSDATGSMPAQSYCPECHQPLILTHDRRNNTPFQYWRCDSGHGRFTSFIDFLREKDYVKPLTPQQIAQLRQMLPMINCSNCGAPIDLTKDTLCRHCGAPLSMLDLGKLAEVANHAEKPPSLPELHAQVVQSRTTLVPTFRNDSLVDLGLHFVRDWLRRLGV